MPSTPRPEEHCAVRSAAWLRDNGGTGDSHLAAFTFYGLPPIPVAATFSLPLSGPGTGRKGAWAVRDAWAEGAGRSGGAHLQGC